MNNTNEIEISEGSGNVFADLGLEDAEAAMAKAELARAIGKIIMGRHLTQVQAAELLGIDQPKVSALMRGRLTGFSIDRLLRFLLALDRDVEIRISARPRSHRRGQLAVVTAA